MMLDEVPRTVAGRADVVPTHPRSRHNGAVMATLIIIVGMIALVLMAWGRLEATLNKLMALDVIGWLNTADLTLVFALFWSGVGIIGLWVLLAARRQAKRSQFDPTHWD